TEPCHDRKRPGPGGHPAAQPKTRRAGRLLPPAQDLGLPCPPGPPSIDGKPRHIGTQLGYFRKRPGSLFRSVGSAPRTKLLDHYLPMKTIDRKSTRLNSSH